MTVQLFKSKKDAEDYCEELYRAIPWTRNQPIKIKFDERDASMFGMRGFTFDAVQDKNYYITAESKKEAKSWGLFSKVI